MVDTQKLRALQEEMAKQIVLEDAKPFEAIQLVAGVDIAYNPKEAVAAVVVMDINTLEVVEKKVSYPQITFPYLPTFLAFREGPAISELVESLEHRPDILLVDGHGISHDARCGLASYVGIKLNMMTIGVAKQLLAGMVKEGKVVMKGEQVGWEIVSREHAKPIYVSPGNLVSLETSKKIVERLLKFPHKMPEPLHIARRIADKKLGSKAFEIESEEGREG